MGRCRCAVLLAALFLLAPNPSAGQAASGDVPPPRNVISSNPFLLIASWFNGEFEHGISGTSTAGLRLSTLSLGVDEPVNGDDDANYFSGRAFWRYYPNGVFAGFYFGLDAGVTSVDDTGDTQTVFGAGFELGYNWLLGARRNFYISMGAGADRLFGGDLEDVSVVIPTVRIINIGFGF